MEKYIAVTKENREFLAKAFRTTPMTISRALRFVSNGGNTPLAQRVRKLAQQRGGILMVASPYMETMHDADGYMRQYFPNGVMLECNKHTGRVELIRDGKAVESFDNVSINQLEAIQAKAQKL